MTEPSRLQFGDPDIGAVDLVLAVARHKNVVLWSGLTLATVAGVITLFLPNLYAASVRILPPQETQSPAAALLGQAGAALGNLAGRDLGLKNPNDIYLAMLSSRTLADTLIDRFGLQQHYRRRSREKTRKKLDSRTTIQNGKDGVISVLVEDQDPEFAARLSNAYAEELMALNQRLAASEAARRRTFYEGQLKQAKEQLDRADAALRDTQMATGLVKMGAQSRSIVAGVSNLQGRLIEKEAQLAALHSFSGDENPEYIRAKMELASLRWQVAQLEKGGRPETRKEGPVGTGELPRASMEYGDRFRQCKYWQMIVELIARQYELARIDEGREAAVIQVLDRAVPPEKKSGPARLGWTLLGFFTGVAFAMLLAIAREIPLLSPVQQEKLRLASAYLSHFRPAPSPQA